MFSWSDHKKVKKTRQVCQFQSGKINGSQGFQFGSQCLAATIHRALEFKSLMQTDLFGGMSLHCKRLNTPGIHIIEIAVKSDGNFFYERFFENGISNLVLNSYRDCQKNKICPYRNHIQIQRVPANKKSLCIRNRSRFS